MKELLKWGAILTGAYLIYQQLTGSSAAPAPATIQPVPSTVHVEPLAMSTTRQLLIQATSGGAPRNFHEWNWFYSQPTVRGVIGPAPENVGMGNGARTITVDEYLAAIGTAGLSGFGRWMA